MDEAQGSIRRPNKTKQKHRVTLVDALEGFEWSFELEWSVEQDSTTTAFISSFLTSLCGFTMLRLKDMWKLYRFAFPTSESSLQRPLQQHLHLTVISLTPGSWPGHGVYNLVALAISSRGSSVMCGAREWFSLSVAACLKISGCHRHP